MERFRREIERRDWEEQARDEDPEHSEQSQDPPSVGGRRPKKRTKTKKRRTRNINKRKGRGRNTNKRRSNKNKRKK